MWRLIRRLFSSGPQPRPRVNQLKAVSRAKFSPQPLMNKSEYRLFRPLEEYVATVGNYHRLFVQVSLAEIIKTTDSDAFWAINQKRCDFVIIAKSGLAVVVIEFQGGGHYQGNAAERDAIKRKALENAGILLIEVHPGFDFGAIRQELDRRLKGTG